MTQQAQHKPLPKPPSQYASELENAFAKTKFRFPDEFTPAYSKETKQQQAKETKLRQEERTKEREALIAARGSNPAVQVGDIRRVKVSKMALDVELLVLDVRQQGPSGVALCIITDKDFRGACGYDVRLSATGLSGERLANVRIGLSVPLEKMVACPVTSLVEPWRVERIKAVLNTLMMSGWPIPKGFTAGPVLEARMNLLSARAKRILDYFTR